jgi:hypothetical protein
VRPLVVSHAARADNPNQFIFGLLPHRPADVRPVCVFLADGSGVIRTLGPRIRRLDAHVVVAQTSKQEVVSGPPTAHRGAVA